VNPKIKRFLAWTGYPLFYFACLALFCYVSAPWDRVKNAVTSGFNASSPLRMEIDRLTWAFRFPGIVAKGVKLVGEAPPPDASGKPRAAPEYIVDELYARVSVFPLLWGTTKLAFSLDGFGGDIDGSVKNATEGRDLLLELDGVDAAKMPYLAGLLGIPIAGSVNGKIDLKLPQNKLPAAEGTVELHITDFEIGDGKTKIRDTLALPKVKAGEFVFKADVTEGVVKITELSTKGPDLEVVSEGRIRLMESVDASVGDLNLRFKFSDAYKSKDDMTKSIFGAPGSSVPGLFDLDPKMKRAKRDDGFYAWHITGPLSRLSFQPSTAGSDSASRARRSPLRGFAKPAPKPPEPKPEEAETPPAAPAPPPAPAPPAPDTPPAP
jgi:type II secretion system protein N